MIKPRVYYNACLNISAINSVGDSLFKSTVYTPLLNLTAFEDRLVFLLGVGVPAFFDAQVGTDDKNSSGNALFIFQGGLGLPSPTYYINQTTNTSPMLLTYHDLIVSLFTLLNQSDANPVTIATDVLTVETMLANAFTPEDELIDPEAVYNLVNVSVLNALAPNINWTRFLQGVLNFIHDGNGIVDVVTNVSCFFDSLFDS